jgi:hypothetical protein
MMKRAVVLLLAIILISVGLSYAAVYYTQEPGARDEFFFGVSFGQQTAAEAKAMIDKVKNYTNFFLINNWDIATNNETLNEVCDYAAQAGLKFIVFFDLISRVEYKWHQTWLEPNNGGEGGEKTAKELWGDKFLGVHLRDELGGKQIDDAPNNKSVAEAADYSDAANRFVANITSSNSTVDAKSKGVPMFISDYALYWFDYLAGYDTVFVELGWNHSTTEHIALCRGAANMQGKDWGAIIVWTYRQEPYLAGHDKILEDMKAAYRAGAKYVVIFDYAENETGPCSTLEEEHFEAMQEFWTYVNANPDEHGATRGQVAFVLPKDYGWGMRSETDNIWGLWPADEKAPAIWENLNKLIQKYSLELDIVYDDDRFNIGEKYSKVYFWNATID